MVLPPLLDDTEAVRPYFKRLRELRDRALGEGLLAAGELSMGMSHDFEAAIEEGATLVRVGTAIFGERRQAERPEAPGPSGPQWYQRGSSSRDRGRGTSRRLLLRWRQRL